MARKISCFLCSRYLGEIREAKLWRGGVFYVCLNCRDKIFFWQRDSEMLEEGKKIFENEDAFDSLGIKSPFKK